MFHSCFERKNDKVLTFNIAHFPIFEISASLSLAPMSKNKNSRNLHNVKLLLGIRQWNFIVSTITRVQYDNYCSLISK